ncbi:MAG: type II toxin-antitoxin system HicA family toxin [Lacunisphaera sp.]|nr:type II toxin-antitoxin system HicA family toxin [Lacunisphaera sp.]
MPNLPGVSGRKTVKALERLGFFFIRQKGSHAMLRRGDRGCVVPMHREINPWTLHGVLKQAGVSADEFLAALK